jgi:hypothetical protein
MTAYGTNNRRLLSAARSNFSIGTGENCTAGAESYEQQFACSKSVANKFKPVSTIEDDPCHTKQPICKPKR